MKKILCSALLFCAMLAKATVLIDPAGSGGFEAGSDFLSNGWTVVNGEATATQNQWYLGTSAIAGIGSGNLAYITNNTAASPCPYAYTNSGPMYTVHFYKDIEFPAGETDIKLSFTYKGIGETSAARDGLQVSLAPTTITPAASATAPATSTVSSVIVSGATIIGSTLYYNKSVATTENIVIPAATVGNSSTNTTLRLMFTFRINSSLGSTPTAIDNISLTSAVPVPEINITGNSAAIVDGLTTPSSSNNTEFGTLSTVATKDITYTILNTGTAALNLTGSPIVAISGSSDFTVLTQPTSPVSATNGTTTFVVRFTPTSGGLRTAEISIANDDGDENPYNFTIQGTGVVALNGEYTIDPSGSGDKNFTTFTSAVNTLNTNLISGPVIFKVAANAVFTEDVSAITATGTATNTVVFQKNGLGSNPVIKPTGTTGTSDFGLKLNGCDYYTFDGIDIQIATGSAVEYGIWLNGSASNGCQNNTFKNGAITLDKTNTNSKGIYLISTATVETGSNSFNKFYNLDIKNCYSGYYIDGSPTSSSYYDEGNEINKLTDGVSKLSDLVRYGIYVVCQKNCKIQNSLFSNISGSVAHINAIYAGNGSGYEISNNSFASISYTGTSTLYYLYGILTNSSISSIDIHDNIFNAVVGSVSPVSAITISGGTSSCYNNTFSGIASTTGTVNAISLSGTTNNCYDNTISGISATTGAANAITVTAGTSSCYGNVIDGVTSETGNSYGINVAGTSVKIYSNTIKNVTASSATSTKSIYGLYANCSSEIYKNKISDISSSTTSTGIAYGMSLSGSSANYRVYNNMIYGIKAPASINTSNSGTIGIGVFASTSVFNNTIVLEYTSTASAHKSACLWSNGTYNMDLRNNIFVNKTNVETGDKAVAFFKNGTALTALLSTNNNNLFYTGTPSAKNLIYSDGTNFDQTLADFKTRMAAAAPGREFSSVTENVAFTSVTDLHINAAVPTQIEKGGTPVLLTSPDFSLADDIDGNARNASFPDIGADEIDGTSIDLIAPSITYINLVNTIPSATTTLSNVVIQDLSGINVTDKKPRCYYSKAATPALGDWQFVEANETTSPFSFTIDYSKIGGVTGGETIKYFVVAQDLSSTPNVGSTPTAGFAAITVDNITSVPTTPSNYNILVTFSGEKSVGTDGDYPSLTGADGLFAAINSGRMTGNLTVKVKSDLTEDGATALNQWVEEPAGTNFALTIEPSDATAKVISGTLSSNKSLIKLNGADRVTIDGKAGNLLTIRNTNSTASSAGAALELTNTSSNCKIINTNLESNSSSTSYGVLILGSTGANSNNLISKCRIANPTGGTHPANAIFSNSTSNTDNKISNNDIVNFSKYGFFLIASGKALLDSNRIYINETSASTALTGIDIDNGADITISANKVYNLNGASTAAITGIYLNLSANNTVAVVNNMINLTPTTTGTIRGIDYNGISTASTNLYFNSVYIGGDQVSGSNASYAFVKRLSVNTMNVKNNIFYNARTNSGTSSGKHCAVGFTNTSGTTIAQTNNLLYVVPNATPANTTLANYSGSYKADLAAWQASLSNLDKDSKNAPVTFETSNTGDLKFIRHSDNAAVFDTGTPITGISTDLYGKTRPQYGQVDIGAYELIQSSDLTETTVPVATTLLQNYPNPFNPETTINFALIKEAQINLTIFNSKGEVVKTLINSSIQAGYHSVKFDGTGLNSGVYFYKLTTPDNCMMKKMVLVK